VPVLIYVTPQRVGHETAPHAIGYMVAADARGQGIASAMCEHSMEEARRTGFTAMQYNYVVASNTTAVKLWQRHGFAIVGTVPRAFRHATLGPRDIHVMHRFL